MANIKTKIIKQIKWSKDADLIGWTWVKQINKNYSIYLHNLCGHDQSVTMYNMSKKSIKCSKCQKDRFKAEANQRNWFFLGKIDDIYSLYTHNLCGINQVIAMSAMRKDQVSCKHCLMEKLKSEAQMQGWQWTEKSIKNGCAFYRHSCGHKQLVTISSMRKGHVACHQCGESWATKTSNTYLIKIEIPNERKFLKLGIARNVLNRTTEYKLPSDAKVTIICTVAYTTGKHAQKVEKLIHKTITTNKNVRRFDASKFMSNGYTECYEYTEQAENALLNAMIDADCSILNNKLLQL